MTESQSVGSASEFAFVRIAAAAESRLPVALRSGTMTRPAYSVGARLLHWITAVLILLMIPLGFVIANDWGGALQGWLYDLHRSIGAVLIPIVLLRLLVWWARPPAELPHDIPPLQRYAARVTHVGLYLLLLVQPLVGWMATSASRAPISVFGLFDLPPICAENRVVSEQLFFAHAVLGTTLCALVAAHIAAALYHHFVRRDRVLMRMIAGRRRGWSAPSLRCLSWRAHQTVAVGGSAQRCHVEFKRRLRVVLYDINAGRKIPKGRF